MKNINKYIFLNTVTCPALGWMLYSLPSEQSSTEGKLADKFRKEQGIEIGKRARKIFPQGVLIEDYQIEQAIAKTRNAINDPHVFTIFEPAFQDKHYVTRVDILNRIDGGWHVIEVKSSSNDKPEFIDDMAYTTYILQKNGLEIKKVSLFLISKNYRLGMPDHELFNEIDSTNNVFDNIERSSKNWEMVEKILTDSNKPELELQFYCKKCSLFTDCIGKNIRNPIFDIPDLREAKFNKLKQLHIISIEDIPDSFSLTDRQEIVRSSIKTHEIIVQPSLKDFLEKIQWPAFYLDFETVMTAIPLYPDITPYTQIPTQYSIHKCSSPGEILEHFDYLADPSRDCRLDLTKKLLHDLEEEGSIIVYSGFEKQRIEGLMKLFPDLQQSLERIIYRIIDLEQIIKQTLYHPEFHGSISIKVTLPVLVSEMSYKDLDIGDGDNAMAAFALMAQNRISNEHISQIRNNLLEYCKRDTLAMVKLHEKLYDYA